MTSSDNEWRAMGRACELAARGPRGVNPQVGAVVLSPTGAVIAEGWHRGAGTHHAEVDALSHLAPGEARGATMVVTLEPCNHTGRTGPCAQALLDAGIARVVYAIDDPADVSGGGSERLRENGVTVASGIRADEVGALLESWLGTVARARPLVSVKWAQSLDGRAAAADGTSRWVTGPEARADVHRRRAEADAILVGIGTVLADDPALTARGADGALAPHQPVPVVVGRRGIPRDAAILRHPHPPIVDDGRDLPGLLARLLERGIHRVFVEGGPTIASAVIRADLADELLIYVAPMLLGGARTALGDIGVPTMAAARALRIIDTVRLGADTLFVGAPASPHQAASPPAAARASAPPTPEREG
ncbi:bifunctional diaminohydroxyphosphoribosylaminopyrimidine deaminase/5-amino-6-(5-phosphoribosylamino)uracil reductase RibD [Microbacterium sp. LRZ72]|uniref:bifunctional diaminohydroxyphosphoribosylaminopyrimidine deaminase/5-amino-6-(5-phosphoribosylamino)uracil reductase RibD n=1 Tax=Microbacterium sp. LRZ72 TaxID=2942481 RepID=UPI0029B94D5A|nr:bifunctional diaminohydroxyphosphoribosylaminopyrimidine deaminase/5-amino-6-(5-phosphoribosylamino)uracil reductase RibD [Microbacterium sp. LRZ72]MDX2376953.1 bifunctional diaminohydroxyphosphoribosylaminopyrimidine deaminase/5-amino-6-(5-phosphoribosylamino)uracil reductase RibD [Microbacterium sp. LRZ72]